MAARKRKRHWLIRTARWVVALIIVLAAIPAVLVPVYLFADPVSVPMLERYLTGQRVVREWRDIEQLSDRLKASVLMSEDGQFCRHWGVDVRAIQSEIEDLLAGRPVRGASTITMQVARNLFLWNDRSYVRKALEIPLAVYIDLVMPKRRILEIYLNIAEWGPDGEFGAAAGAAAAFGIEPQNLSWERASLLTTALPNPHVRLPGSPSARVRDVARIIAGRAQQYGQRAACVAPSGVLAL